MKTILKEKYLTVFIIVSILAFPLFELIGVFFDLKFFLQEQTLSLIGIIGCILAIIWLILSIKNKEKPKLVLSDFFIITSIIFCIISIIFSKCIHKSLIGIPGYSETPLQVLGYFTLFIICTMITKEENRKSILITFFIIGIINAIAAFMQNFRLWPIDSYFETPWHTKDHLAFGLTQHCNIYASLSTIFTSLFASSFIYSNNKKLSVFYLFGAIICCTSAYFTYTRLAWLGTFSILFGILILEIALYRKKRCKQSFIIHIKKYVIIFICILACFLTVGISSGQIKRDVDASQKEIHALTSEKKVESLGTGRGTLWKAGLSALKKCPFTGVGFDIYGFSFFLADDSPLISQNKGHSEYIHTLVTQGIFSGINFVLFVFYCICFPFKKILEMKTDLGKSNLTKIFLIAIFAYSVQALFTSSITNVAIYKWILVGLVLPKNEQTDLKIIFNRIKDVSKKEVKLLK